MDVQCLFQNSRQIEHGFTFIFHELHNITLCFHILVIHTVIPSDFTPSPHPHMMQTPQPTTPLPSYTTAV